MKAMILAAGLGTRLKPFTDTTPKALVPILGKPVLEHVIEKLKTAGFNEIIINIHHFADQIVDFVASKNNFNIRIEFSDERAKLLDTGGAIKKAAWFLNDNEPILIHNADILSDIDFVKLYDSHIENDSIATLVVNNRKTSRYLFFDENDYLQGWINEKDGKIISSSVFDPLKHEKLAFFGIHILSSKAIQEMKNFPDKFSIIDFYLSICNKSHIRAFRANQNTMVDVGKLDSLEKAEEFLQSQS